MKSPRLTFFFALCAAPALLSANFTLTILHFNDPESHLLNAGNPQTDPATVPTANARDLENYGGASRFVTIAKAAYRDAKTDAVLRISAGDNYLPGLVLDASNPALNNGNPDGVNYDAKVFAEVGTDLTTIGNHEFDPGPEYLAGFIDAVHNDGCAMRTVSCNIDTSAVPELAKNVTPSAVFDFNGEKVGVVGATTWLIPSISSPGKIQVIDANGNGKVDIDDTAILVQREIDKLTAAGVNKIILTAHLQSIRYDQELIQMLHGVDIDISGGGHEVLVNDKGDTIPGTPAPFGPYPILNDAAGKPVRDLDGRNVPIITAGSGLDYLGRLVVEFDDSGNVISAAGEPILIAAIGPSHSEPDAETNREVVQPVYAYIHKMSDEVTAVSEVELDAQGQHTRRSETNLGDLVADALLSEGRRQALLNGRQVPNVAVTNGGGIRSNDVIHPGNLTNITLKHTLPFTNYVTLVNDVTPAEFKALAEQMTHHGGGFGQVSGFRMVYDPAGNEGNRVKELTLADGTAIVRDGAVVANAPTVCFATVDYLARGGDGYPFDASKTYITPVLLSEALRRFLTDDLGGKIDAKHYPASGLGRVVAR